MKKKAVVLVDPASSGENLKRAAHTLGYQVICIFTQPKESFEALYKKEHKSAFVDCDHVILTQDKEIALTELKTSPFLICAVIAGSEVGVEMADQLAYALDLWRNPIELSTARRHKGEMRRVLKASGLTYPDYSICYSEEDILNFVKNHSFDLIIKTPKGVMTSQVYKCSTLANTLFSFYKILNEKNIFGEMPNCAVIEEFISGREYIVDTFSDGNTIHVTDLWYYDFIDTEEFKNIYYNAISLPLDDPAYDAIKKYGIAVAKQFGVERGFAHIEIIDSPQKGPVLIEIGARLPGMRLTEFIKKYGNFDPYEATIEVFTQGAISIPDPILTRHCAIVFCPTLEQGTVKKIHGVEEIQRLSSYESHLLYLKVGDPVHPSTHGSTIPIVVFLSHADRPQLLADVKAVHHLFHLTV